MEELAGSLPGRHGSNATSLRSWWRRGRPCCH